MAWRFKPEGQRANDERGDLRVPEDLQRDSATEFRPEGLTGEKLVQINPGAICRDCGYPALAHAVGGPGLEVICPRGRGIAIQNSRQGIPYAELEDYVATSTAATELQLRSAQAQREALSMTIDYNLEQTGNTAAAAEARYQTARPGGFKPRPETTTEKRLVDGLARAKRQYDDDY